MDTRHFDKAACFAVFYEILVRSGIVSRFVAEIRQRWHASSGHINCYFRAQGS